MFTILKRMMSDVSKTFRASLRAGLNCFSVKTAKIVKEKIQKLHSTWIMYSVLTLKVPLNMKHLRFPALIQ